MDCDKVGSARRSPSTSPPFQGGLAEGRGGSDIHGHPANSPPGDASHLSTRSPA